MSNNKFEFTRANRLLTSADFKKVFDNAKKSGDKYFTVLVSNNDLNVARLGLAISKKNTRLAVQRNRLKRLIRESFRLNNETLLGIDIVVLASYRASKQNNSVLISSLDKHWTKVTDII